MTQAPETFRCDRQNMTLTVPGCARLWRSARGGPGHSRPMPWEGRAHCVGCPVGALHAGERIEDATAARYEAALRKFCPRCIRPASRLINGRFCVSCYNRDREVAIGRNCKGNPPKVVAARLHAVSLMIGERPETFPSVTSRAEAIVIAAKRARGPAFFAPVLSPTLPEGLAA